MDEPEQRCLSMAERIQGQTLIPLWANFMAHDPDSTNYSLGAVVVMDDEVEEEIVGGVAYTCDRCAVRWVAWPDRAHASGGDAPDCWSCAKNDYTRRLWAPS